MTKRLHLKFPLIFLSIAIAVFFAASLFSLVTYQESVLSKPSRYSDLNVYWEDRLTLKSLSIPLGAHYWDGDDLVFVSPDKQLVKARWQQNQLSDFEVFRELPDGFEQPVRLLHQTGALAGRDKVYHWTGDRGWTTLIDDFIVWHTSVEYLSNDVLLVGEYGNRVLFFNLDDFSVSRASYKPDDTRHFHFVRRDPYTGYLYASLGDTHTNWVTGIMISINSGLSWEWLHQTRRRFEKTHKQPTAVYFLKDRIIFGSDSSPDGIYVYDKLSGEFRQSFVMEPALKSWFTDIRSHGGVFWAISRSFGQSPKFGVLWVSLDGYDWRPVQIFEQVPMWIGNNSHGAMTIGFAEGAGVYFNSPSHDVMEQYYYEDPSLNLSVIDEYKFVFSREWIDIFKNLIRIFYRAS